MKCPRCGADNAPEADWCYLCEYPFTASGGIESGPEGGGEKVGPGVPPQAPPPGQTGMPAQTPPGMRQPGYTGMPPGQYPPGYQPPPPSGMSTGIKILIGVGAALGIVVIALVLAFLAFGTAPSIKVSAPPGWEKADEELMEITEEEFDSEAQDIKLDYMFTDGTLTNIIVVYHGEMFILDTPDSENFEDVESFFTEHKDEILDELAATYQGIGANYTVKNYEVVEMANGISALQISISVTGGNMAIAQDILLFFKEGTGFNITITKVGTSGNEEEIEFFKENISFE